MKCDVISLENKTVGSIDLDETVFGVPVRGDILARMVNWQLAKRRAGTHKTKGVSEVSGTTKKPFRQKGTGRARQGSSRSTQMRGGGIVFGPVVRDHAHDLTKKVRKLALKTALSAKQADGKLVVLESTQLKEPKTRDLVKTLEKLGWTSALIIDGTEVDANFAKAARNILALDVLPSQGANVHDILRRETLVLTKDAVANLVERLK
ncbi:MAG: 50S ribosomal protein L4 [Rhodospirillales bacterium]|nr:50S ribosomal protein L4 [Rhodospirillales bacterium]